jgi:hypothetical protein
MIEPDQHEIADQGDRQEQKNERVGVKEHTSSVRAVPKSLTIQGGGQQAVRGHRLAYPSW